MRDDILRARAPVAVVGIAALCPGDPTTDGFLSVMMEGRDQIRDVPPSRFSREHFGAPDPSERGDRTYCTRGAFIEPVPFDPMAFGIPPSVIAATDSAQLLTLLKARELMEDAGIDRWGEAARERVGVILGAQGMTQLQALMMSRIHWPDWVEELRAMGVPEDEALAAAARINARRPAWQEMSFPGFLGNITAGRVTNRLDLGGTNYVVDAACASSLSAISAALNELHLGLCDAVITGGSDLLTDAGTFLSFANSTALSRSGDCRPFSADADGTVIGEGVALLALRRLADAEAAGDAIHAVIRGHGTASDGRGSAIYAPRSEGQVRAMERAYEAAGYGPETVGLIEAHGTGTELGDATEVRSMTRVFGGPGRTRRAALGSVKSLIGHAKTSAGAVSLLKVVTALRHGVLPPTIKVGRPNEALEAQGCPVHPNTVARPWIAGDAPRRAALSAFGFGGANAHLTVEEYRGPHRAARRLPLPAQLMMFSGPSREAALAAASEAADRAGRGAAMDGLARAGQEAFDPSAPARLGLVARDAAALAAVLAKVSALLEQTGALPAGLEGAAYAEGAAEPGRIAFLFPGQGSQRIGMAGDLAMHFEAARAPWDIEDTAARAEGLTPLHEAVFPDPALTEEEASAQEARLRATETAQPALALATLSHLALTDALALRPDLSLGHSFGEVMALHAAGAFDAAAAVCIARERGRLMAEAGQGTEGAMTSLSLPAEEVEALITRSGAAVRIANRNAPRQVVVSGPASEVGRLEAVCPAGAARRLPVSTAFHSPVVADAAPRFGAFLEAVWTEPPRGVVIANRTAAPYPQGIEACRETLASQIANEVRFHDGVRAAFEAGARTFVEVGPGAVLSRLAAQCLEGESVETVPLGGGAGVAGFLGALARLAVQGVPLRWDALWEDRRVGPAEPPAALKPHVVWVDSTMRRRTEAERLAGREPYVVGAASGEAVGMARGPGQKAGAIPLAPAVDEGVGTPPAPARSLVYPVAEAVSSTGNAGSGSTWPAGAGEAPAGEPTPGSEIRATADAGGGAPERPAPRPVGMPMHADMGSADTLPFGAEALLSEVSAVQERFLATMSKSHSAYLGMVAAALGASAPTEARASHARTFAPAGGDGPASRGPADLAPVTAEARGTVAPLVAPDEPAPVPAYHDAAPAPVAAVPANLEALVTAVIAEKTGYPADMLEPAMELEADLGVDSIRRVEIILALQEGAPGLIDSDSVSQEVIAALRTIGDVAAFLRGLAGAAVPSVDAASTLASAGGPVGEGDPVGERAGVGSTEAILTSWAAPSEEASTSGGEADGPVPAPPRASAAAPHELCADGAEIDPAQALLEVVAEATGYPADMLEMDMQLEADLGIDSIKRMEILMALGERLPGRLPPPEEVDMAAVAGLVTLADVVDHLRGAGRAEEPGPVAGDVDGPVSPIADPRPTGEAMDVPRRSMAEVGPEASRGDGVTSVRPRHADAATGPEAAAAAMPPRGGTIEGADGTSSSVPAGMPSPREAHSFGSSGPTTPLRTHRSDTAEPQGASAGGRSDPAGADEQHVARDEASPDFFVPTLAAARVAGEPLLRRGEGPPVQVMPDGGGVAEALVRALGERGVPAEVAEVPSAHASRLVFLGGLDMAPDAATGGAIHRAAFEAIRAAAPGLRSRGVLVAVASAGRPSGLAAMTLTAAKEWPEARCKAIQLGEAAGPEAAAEAIVAELVEGGPEPEVVLDGDARCVPVLRRAARGSSATQDPAVDERSVVMISGGARGVAAACAEALARRHRPRLVLIGRTPLAPEPDHLAGAEGEAEVKAAILAHARDRDEAVEPAEVGRRAAAALSAREARRSIARIEEAGSEVLHAAADIRDRAALAAVLDEARDRWGPVTGVVHAAGVIADRRIEDKAPESFAEVFATKVAGFEALLAATAQDPVRLVVAFSSVAARFGSAGQIDYAAANAALGAMARREAKARAGRCLVRAIEWGPWDGGMVSPALARHMRGAGLSLIDVEAGARAFCDLVDDPGLGGVETVVTGEGNLAALGWPRLEAPVSEAAE